MKKNGRESEIVAGNYQFIFAGNPGTGKTTVGKSMAQILSICGIRSDTFKQYTGTELLHIGSTKFLADIEQMRGSRSGGGPSNDELPKDRFLEQEIVEVDCNGKWYKAEIVRKQNSLPSLNKDGTVAQSEDKYEVKYAKYNDTVPFSKIRRVNRTRRAGGTIFIDECYDLEPSSNKDGKLILGPSLSNPFLTLTNYHIFIGEIMSLADPGSDSNISVILAGYKDEIEREIFGANIGMYRRFTVLNFDDYADDQLVQIFKDLCAKKNFLCTDNVLVTVKNRLRRQKTKGKGFGNGGAVESLFVKVANNAQMRVYGKYFSSPQEMDKLMGPNSKIELLVSDVIGPPIDVATNVQLRDALEELNRNFIGIKEVKASITNLVELVKRSYDQELHSHPPMDIWLHKLFLGNPGSFIMLLLCTFTHSLTHILTYTIANNQLFTDSLTNSARYW